MKKISKSLNIALVGVLNPKAGGAHTAGELTANEIKDALDSSDRLTFYGSEKRSIVYRIMNQIRSTLLHLSFKFSTAKKLHYLLQSPLEKRLTRENIDLAIFLSPSDLIGDFCKIPLISTIWDIGHRQFPFFPEMGNFGEFERREKRYENSIKKAHIVITDSVFTAENLSVMYGANKLKFLPMPFAPIPNTITERGRDKGIAFYPAHFWMHKNHTVIINAVHKLVTEKRVPRKVIFSGLDQGYQAVVEGLAKSLNVEDHFEFRGFIPKEEVTSLYQSAYITLMPSMLGPTNLPPLEALILGCPVAASIESTEGFNSLFPFIRIGQFDIENWALVLDQDFLVEKVKIAEVHEVLASQRKENIRSFSQMINNFRLLP